MTDPTSIHPSQRTVWDPLTRSINTAIFRAGKDGFCRHHRYIRSQGVCYTCRTKIINTTILAYRDQLAAELPDPPWHEPAGGYTLGWQEAIEAAEHMIRYGRLP